MPDPYIGEIRMFAGNFAPAEWALCDGASLPISQYPTLFAVIGTTYGGDGQMNFNLPDLRSRVPVHQGNGYALGQMAGVETVTLTAAQVAAHSHTLQGTSNSTTALASNALLAPTSSLQDNTRLYGTITTEPAVFSGRAVSSAPAGSTPHTNIQPYVCVNFIISLFGVFPSSS